MKILTTIATVILMSTLSKSASASSLVEFPAQLKTLSFQILTDQIRGGKTSAGISIDSNSNLVFAGNLRLLDGAGFALVNLRNLDLSPFDLSRSMVLTFTAVGDGREYRLVLHDVRSEKGGGQIAYEIPFRSSASPQVVTLRLSELVAMRRGKAQPQAPAIDLSKVESIGFEVADKIEQPFKLSIGKIEAN